MQVSGVNGYTVGFGLLDAKATDLASVEVSLYQAEKLLAKNTSTYKLHRLMQHNFPVPLILMVILQGMATGTTEPSPEL